MKNHFKFAIIFLTLVTLLSTIALANPTVTSITQKNVDEGSEIKFTITTTSPNNGPTIFSFCYYIGSTCSLTDISNNKAEAVVDSTIASITKKSDTSAEFKWKPDLTQGRSSAYRFKIQARDNDPDEVSSKNFNINVRNVPSKITSPETILVGGQANLAQTQIMMIVMIGT